MAEGWSFGAPMLVLCEELLQLWEQVAGGRIGQAAHEAAFALWARLGLGRGAVCWKSHLQPAGYSLHADLSPLRSGQKLIAHVDTPCSETLKSICNQEVIVIGRREFSSKALSARAGHMGHMRHARCHIGQICGWKHRGARLLMVRVP